MSTTKLILLVIASLIILILAGYAIYLKRQIQKNEQQAQEKDEAERKLAQQNLDKRNQNIIADIRFIAQSVLTDQCEITEGVLRIHHLADALDSDIMQQTQFSTLHSHFNACKSMAIKEAYKSLAKKQRFQQDQKRFRLEEENKPAILKEAQLIIEYSFANLKNLH